MQNYEEEEEEEESIYSLSYFNIVHSSSTRAHFGCENHLKAQLHSFD